MSRTSTLNNKSPLGILIVMQLHKLGKNQKWLADGSGMSQVYLCNILAGRANPTMKSLRKLAQNLDIDVKDLANAMLSKN